MNVVFDFGGVLFDWDPPSLLQRELPGRVSSGADGVRWAADFFQGYEGDWGAFDRGTIDVPELVHRIATRTGLGPDEVRRVVDGVPLELQPKPAMVALLRRLHAAGHALFYLSNMPAVYAAHLLTTHDFLTCFKAGVFSSHVHLNKPEAAIYELASARFGLAPASLLFMDDHPQNIAAAQALGWQGFVYAGAAAAEAEFVARGALP